MPRVQIPGAVIEPGVIGPRQVAALPATKAASPPLEVKKYCQNGIPPSAQYWNQLNEQTNQAALFRPKQVFSYSSRLGINGLTIGTSASGSTPLWRFAFHLGPYSTRLMIHVVMGPPDAGFGTASYGKLLLHTSATEAVAVSTSTFYYGTPPSSSYANGFQYLKESKIPVEGLTANTTYYARFDNYDYGQIVCASVFELPSLTENLSGYLPQTLGQDSEVLAVYRQNVATVQKNIWKYGAPTVLNWTADPQSSPKTIASATATNLIDGTSTTYGSSIPGYTLDMTGKDRRMQTSGVPVKMFAHVSCTSASNGTVVLRDSSGVAVITLTNTYGAGVAGWISGTGFLPASSGKYYLTHSTAAGTLSTKAVSLIEYEA